MVTASKLKNSEKQAICKKITAVLKKRYGGTIPKIDLPVMESLIFAICLEDETFERAREYYDRLFDAFHDLNEIRVSSIGELEAAFQGISHPEWRALRVRNVLQYVFEKHYVFDFESLRKKTIDLATRQLGKIPHLSHFARNWVIQNSLGGHLLPLDHTMRDAAVWLGLVESTQNEHDASESLKAVIRKPETPLFASLLKSLAIDPQVRPEIAAALKKSKTEFDATTAVARLPELFASAESAGRKKKKAVADRKKAQATARAAKEKPAPGRKAATAKKAKSPPARKK